ncbi:hypothetical protein [Pseudomonas lopnurensis]|uniref:hypothetical protein n=1 Tax=Pseudomonas lopnurensis TaxID=1477517 RepID=UPI0028AD208F|nr:hypothetical protein [Pseudomonas lopnurensis]
MKKIVSLLGVALALALPAGPVFAADKLFKNYIYGAPLSEFNMQPGYYDCSAEVGLGAICLDDVDFIGRKFTAALIFSNDKLYMLSLLTEYDLDTYTTLIGTLAKSFSLIALADGNSQLDLIDLAQKSRGKESFAATLNNYERVGLNAGNLTYSFIEGTDMLSRNFANATVALASAPDNIRSADMVVYSEGVESALIVRFAFPKLELKKAAQVMAAPAEDF